MGDMKYLNLKYFRDFGLLQEVNRQFFHPIGLALEMQIDEAGNVSLSGIQDHTEDPAGVVFGVSPYNEAERYNAMCEKVQNVLKVQKRCHAMRECRLGFLLEPIY